MLRYLVEHERLSEVENAQRDKQAAYTAMAVGMAMGGGKGAKEFIGDLLKGVSMVDPHTGAEVREASEETGDRGRRALEMAGIPMHDIEIDLEELIAKNRGVQSDEDGES